MTKRTSKHAQLVKRLKALLLTGSVLATFAGTRLLDQQEAIQQAPAISQSEPLVIVVPASDRSALLLPQQSPRTRLQLEPIPQAARPRLNPVARTRSSR